MHSEVVLYKNKSLISLRCVVLGIDAPAVRVKGINPIVVSVVSKDFFLKEQFVFLGLFW